MSVVKKMLVALLIVLVILQFIRPSRNTGVSLNDEIRSSYNITPEMEQLLKTSCFDCHSNNTIYPWYTNIQPVGLWLQNHVNEGKGELNFSELKSYSPKKLDHKFEEIAEMIKKEEMPLTSYTIIHGDAKLTQQQRELIINWANQNRTSMNYKED